MIKRRFSAQQSTVLRDLRNVMTKIDATSLKTSTDEFTGEVKVIFDRDGKRYTKTCNKWDISLDNLRAIQLSIEYLYRAVEVYGVETDEEFNDLFNSMFIGLEATPSDDVLMIGTGEKDWREILGVKKDCSKKDIINAYKSLAKVHHPDVGGDKHIFIRLRKAYEDGLKEVK